MAQQFGTAYNIGQGQYRAGVNAYLQGTQTGDTARYRVSTWGELKNIDGWSASNLWRAWWNGSSWVWTEVTVGDGNCYCTYSSSWQYTNQDVGIEWTETKGHSKKTLWFATEFRCGSGTYSHAEIALEIPARDSYTVSFNANGGTGAPSAQTKWYNETLTLSSTRPTRAGYDFLGWGASSSATTVSYNAGASYTANSGTTLYALWKPTSSTISSVKNITLGDNVEIKWTPKATDYKYKLKFTLGSETHTTDYISPNSTSEYTYTGYAIPTSWAAQIPNAISGIVNVELTSYTNEETQLGTSSSAFTLTLPNTLKPTVVPSVSETSNNSTIESWQNPPFYTYIAGYSKIALTATATAQQGASITNITVTGSASASGYPFSHTTGVQTAGDKTFTFVATDSRGMQSAPETITVNVTAYSPPEVSMFTAERKPAPNITVVDVYGVWSFSDVGNNTFTKLLEYKTSTGSTWSVLADDIQSQTPLTLIEPFTDSLSYNIRLTITDSLGNASSRTVYIPTMYVWMHYPTGGQGVAFGKTSETGNFEINYDLEVYGDAEIQDSLSVSGLDHTITQADYYDIANLIANPYKTTLSYEVGDWVTYNSSVWECTTATTGTWDSSDWREIDGGS